MISKEDIKKLAVLARITVSDKEATDLASEAEGILGYVFDVGEVSAEGLGDAHTALTNAMREDIGAHEAGVYTEKILAQAPREKDNYIEVRKVITKE